MSRRRAARQLGVVLLLGTWGCLRLVVFEDLQSKDVLTWSAHPLVLGKPGAGAAGARAGEPHALFDAAAGHEGFQVIWRSSNDHNAAARDQLAGISEAWLKRLNA